MGAFVSHIGINKMIQIIKSIFDSGDVDLIEMNETDIAIPSMYFYMFFESLYVAAIAQCSLFSFAVARCADFI